MTTRNLFGRFAASAVAATTAASLCATCPAQSRWVVSNAGVYLGGEGRADDYLNNGPAAVVDLRNDQQTVLIPGFRGLSYGNRFGLDAKEQNFVGLRESVVVASSKGMATIAGDGTAEITIEWLIRASTESDALDGYDAQSYATLDGPRGERFFVELDTSNVPAGSPLIIYYSWDARSHATNKDEPAGTVWPNLPAPLDYAEISNASLRINGVDQLGPFFSFDVVPPFTSIEYALKNQTGQINMNAGQILRIDITGLVETGIFPQGRGWTQMEDGASAIFHGRIRLTTGTPTFPPNPPAPTPGPPDPSAVALLFSTDIGSDTELSAMPASGRERFDPGDMYLWRTPPLPPGGANGFHNDADAFTGIDPFPTPAMPGGLLPPLCSGVPISLVAPQFVNVDGHSSLEFSLDGLWQAGVAPPIGFFNSPCVNGADYLLISLKDNGESPYTDCNLPTNTSASPAGIVYGTTAGRDEVIGLTLSTYPPAAVINIYPLAGESQVHVSLGPDPAAGSDQFDDDVNALDAPNDPTVCSRRYFSVHHEASGVDPVTGLILDAGAVYEVVPGGSPVKVVDPFLHLGLPVGTDLADFDFVWLENPAVPSQPMNLAMIFAVHPDDPTTADDESGGLNPKRLYASFLDGAAFPLLPGVFENPVDAVASVRQDLFGIALPPPPSPCPGDANGDRRVDFADITTVLVNFGNTYPPGPPGPGDTNGDGVVNFADVTTVLVNFGRVCP